MRHTNKREDRKQVESASVYLNFKANSAEFTGQVQKVSDGVKRVADTFEQTSQRMVATGKKIENIFGGISKILELDAVRHFGEDLQKGFERIFEEASQS